MFLARRADVGGWASDDKIRTCAEAKLFLSRSSTLGPKSRTSDTECFKSKAKLFLSRSRRRRLLVTLRLTLAVVFQHLRVPLAVLFLVVGMFVPPLLLSVADDLKILRVCCQLLAVIIAAPPTLALRPTAHPLLETINAGLKRTVAVRTTAGWVQSDSSGIIGGESLRRIETVRRSQVHNPKLKTQFRNCCRVLTASSPTGDLYWITGSGLNRLERITLSSALTIDLVREMVHAGRTQARPMQQGSIIQAERKIGPDVWEFRWREPGPDGKRKHRGMVIGRIDQPVDESAARERIRSRICVAAAYIFAYNFFLGGNPRHGGNLGYKLVAATVGCRTYPV
jgi:hypothetical protein